MQLDNKLCDLASVMCGQGRQCLTISQSEMLRWHDSCIFNDFFTFIISWVLYVIQNLSQDYTYSSQTSQNSCFESIVFSFCHSFLLKTTFPECWCLCRPYRLSHCVACWAMYQPCLSSTVYGCFIMWGDTHSVSLRVALFFKVKATLQSFSKG